MTSGFSYLLLKTLEFQLRYLEVEVQADLKTVLLVVKPSPRGKYSISHRPSHKIANWKPKRFMQKFSTFNFPLSLYPQGSPPPLMGDET